MTTTKLSACLTCTLLIAALGPVGCGAGGPRTYPASGTVTLDGQPVPDGYIIFTCDDSKIPPVTGQIEAGGYALRVTEGRHRVEVQASQFVGPENPIMGLRAREQYIPDRYNVESELTAEVVPGGNNLFEFALVSDAANQSSTADATE